MMCWTVRIPLWIFASGITGIVNAVYNQANLTVCVLDNSTTAMTGHQPHPGTGHTMMGQVVDKVSIVKILEAVGVTKIVTVDPLDLELAVNTVKEVSGLEGVKAVIFKSPCIAIVKSAKRCRIDIFKRQLRFFFLHPSVRIMDGPFRSLQHLPYFFIV